MADPNNKPSLQKHESVINTLEKQMEILHLCLEEEQHRPSENMEEVHNQLIQLIAANMDNTRKFEELMEGFEFFERNSRGKAIETTDAGSSNQGHKPTLVRNNGPPYGFVPFTPQPMGFHNDNPPWEEAGQSKIKTGFGHGRSISTPVEGQTMGQGYTQHKPKVRPPTS